MTESTREQRLQAILHTFLQAVDRGEKPDRRAILDANPDLRDELAAYFADASKLDQMAKSLKTASFGGGTSEASPSLGKIRYFGDYELLEEIARGGMGVVFKAKQVSLNRIVALKMILKGELANEADIRRFRQEAEAAANLDHPNIVPIYEVGEHDGQQYFSMKLIDTKATLGHEFGGASPDTHRGRANQLEKVARAVHHAHQRGILHRDLKPSNILIDTNGEPHVADFGLAKKVEDGEDATKSGAIVGTPAYMAPEQARAEKSLTTAVDVWSLGAIFYEWLTGRPPFRGDDALSVLMQVVSNEPANPRSLDAKIDRDLETICLKCLEKEPTARYTSAAALADDLDRWLGSEPISARPIGSFERGLKWVKRHRGISVAVAVAVLALLSGTVVSTWQAFVANAEAIRANANEKLTGEQRDRADREAALATANAKKATEQRDRAEQLVYAGKLALAQGAFREGNGGLALGYLNDCQTDLRGWESRHLWARFNSKQTFPGLHAALSPDGKRLAIADRETFQVWDAEMGTPLHTLGKEHVLAAVYSPDGRRIASASPDHHVKLWDAESGQLVFTYSGHKGRVPALAFSPDGERIISGSDDKTVRVWDAKLGKAVLVFDKHSDKVETVAISPDGERITASAHNWAV